MKIQMKKFVPRLYLLCPAFAKRSFFQLNGFSILLRDIKKPSRKICTIAIFLTEIIFDVPKSRDPLQSLGVIQLLLYKLQREYNASTKDLLTYLVCLVQNHEASYQECMSDQLRLKETLRNLRKMATDHPEVYEIKGYIHSLEHCCNCKSYDEDNTLEETER